MNKENMNIEEVVLAPNTEIFDAAERVALTSSEKEKYYFTIEYDLNEKEFLISMLEKSGCEIEKISDSERNVVVTMNKDQLKVIKALDCVHRVIANDDLENTEAVLTNASKNAIINSELETGQASAYATNRSIASTSGNTMSTAIQLPIDAWRGGSIECDCGEAWFKFTANAADAHSNGGKGEYIVTTSGTIDTKGYLYDSSGRLIGEDDDSGIGMQFSITAMLEYGATYYICVREYNCRAGDFTIKVTYTPIESTGEDMVNALPLSIGTTKNGNISCPEGAVWYEFVANDTSVHTSGYAKYDVTLDSSANITVNLYTNTNQHIPFYESKRNGNTYVRSAKLYYGYKYYAVVEPVGQQCGSYSISVDGIAKWVNVTSVTINQTSCTITEGHTYRLTATVKPDNATDKSIIWSTSNYRYADVGAATGVVRAKQAGAVTITAKSHDNSSKTHSILATIVSPDLNEPSEDDCITPTPLEAAYMADHIYIAKKDTEAESYGGWRLVDVFENSQGLKYGVYEKGAVDAVGYAFVNAGSTVNVWDDLSGVYNDWVKNNFTQLFGNSQDMKDSINAAIEFVQRNCQENVTFIGHSKGGAEAICNAIATNKNAIVFNSARPNYSIYGLSRNEYNGNVTSYFVDGEILSQVYDALENLSSDEMEEKFQNTLIGKIVFKLVDYVNDHATMSPQIGEKIILPSQSSDAIENHSIASIISALESIVTPPDIQVPSYM